MPRLQPDKAECFVSVFREGALSRVGHDVMLELKRVELTVAEDDSSISAEMSMDSLRVVGSIHGTRVDRYELSPKDQREIEANARKVLEPERYPRATFVSDSVTRDGDAYSISGELTLHGVKRRIAIKTVREGQHAIARVVLHQPDYKIKPFKALLGTLRIKPDVKVEMRIPFADDE